MAWEPQGEIEAILGAVGSQWKVSKRRVSTSEVPFYKSLLAGDTGQVNERGPWSDLG